MSMEIRGAAAALEVNRANGINRAVQPQEHLPENQEKPIVPPERAFDRYEPEEKQSVQPQQQAEQTTINTDKVDREIESLKNRQNQLNQQLQTAQGPEAERLQRQLDQVEQQLNQKDNDSYRRQNAVIS